MGCWLCRRAYPSCRSEDDRTPDQLDEIRIQFAETERELTDRVIQLEERRRIAELARQESDRVVQQLMREVEEMRQVQEETAVKNDPDGKTFMYSMCIHKIRWRMRNTTTRILDRSGLDLKFLWYAGSVEDDTGADTGAHDVEVSASFTTKQPRPFDSFLVVSFEDRNIRRLKMTLTLTETDGEHLAVAFLDVAAFSEDNSFRHQQVELQNSAGVVAVAELHTSCQNRWAKQEVAPQTSAFFVEPKDDDQAEASKLQIMETIYNTGSLGSSENIDTLDEFTEDELVDSADASTVPGSPSTVDLSLNEWSPEAESMPEDEGLFKCASEANSMDEDLRCNDEVLDSCPSEDRHHLSMNILVSNACGVNDGLPSRTGDSSQSDDDSSGKLRLPSRLQEPTTLREVKEALMEFKELPSVATWYIQLPCNLSSQNKEPTFSDREEVHHPSQVMYDPAFQCQESYKTHSKDSKVTNSIICNNTDEDAFLHLPSVATWHMRLQARKVSLTPTARDSVRAPCKHTSPVEPTTFVHLPSVGTWNMPRHRRVALTSSESKPLPAPHQPTCAPPIRARPFVPRSISLVQIAAVEAAKRNF
eukprot:TRINITY_DN12702_c0_g1_i1.p1 TRINITY_DN12702_c0_g1~~TRINITY_DN12702_c0_g1_i1.p1  ORF type:complete len:589 (-),score=76.73 TRINITY_DN12702_c0_g1_i1:93-1859(-)